LWARAGELVEVDLEGTRGWVLAEDAGALLGDAQAGGARLLPNRDPLNAARDRELLVPDPALRQRIWTSLGGPGTVMVEGDVAGLWRPAKKGAKLVITVEPLGALSAAAKEELAAEAERIAPFRAAGRSEVRLASNA
jgi:Winged helix DNA-binding domain